MRKWISRILFVVSIILLSISLYFLMGMYLQDQKSETGFDSIRQIHEEQETNDNKDDIEGDSNSPAIVDPGLLALHEKNVDQGTEAAQEESTTETEEPVVEDTHTEENGDPFSVPGNGEVRDDITDDSSKEFLTIKTKNNNTFYIVIDRAATTNNVYMLSQIDENDLKEFLDEDQQQTLETAPSVVLKDEHTDDTESNMVVEEETQADKPDKTATNSGLFVILLLAVAGIAGYYYFKIYKPKQEDDDSENEGLEMDDGLETINEDEESDNPAEKDESQE